MGGWVDGYLQEIMPFQGSILQAGTFQIFSCAENPRWSRVWQYWCCVGGGGSHFHVKHNFWVELRLSLGCDNNLNFNWTRAWHTFGLINFSYKKFTYYGTIEFELVQSHIFFSSARKWRCCVEEVFDKDFVVKSCWQEELINQIPINTEEKDDFHNFSRNKNILALVPNI